MEKRLQNKIALITGGSRGIGAAIAKRFAKEGCHVAISYTESKEKALSLINDLEKEGIKALALQADQVNPLQATNLSKKVGEHFGKIDILVNNAGIYVGGSIDDANLDIDGITRQLAINVGGVFATTRAAIPFIKGFVFSNFFQPSCSFFGCFRSPNINLFLVIISNIDQMNSIVINIG